MQLTAGSLSTTSRTSVIAALSVVSLDGSSVAAEASSIYNSVRARSQQSSSPRLTTSFISAIAGVSSTAASAADSPSTVSGTSVTAVPSGAALSTASPSTGSGTSSTAASSTSFVGSTVAAGASSACYICQTLFAVKFKSETYGTFDFGNLWSFFSISAFDSLWNLIDSSVLDLFCWLDCSSWCGLNLEASIIRSDPWQVVWYLQRYHSRQPLEFLQQQRFRQSPEPQ